MTPNAASISPGLATSPLKMNSQVLVDGTNTLLSENGTSSKSMPCSITRLVRTQEAVLKFFRLLRSHPFFLPFLMQSKNY